MDNNNNLFPASLGLVLLKEGDFPKPCIYTSQYFGGKGKYIEYLLPDGTTKTTFEEYHENGTI